MGPARCLGLTISGISYRMFRSAVTVVILALAVAFFTQVLATEIISHETRLSAYAQLKNKRLLGEWVSRLSRPTSRARVRSLLDAGDPDRLAEFGAWSGATDEQMAQARAIASRMQKVVEYLEQLSPTNRAVLIADTEPEVALLQLAERENFDRFVAKLEDLRLVPPLGDRAAFEELMFTDGPVLGTMIRRIRQGHAEAIEQVRARLGDRSPQALFANPLPSLPQRLADAGFVIEADALGNLAEQAHYEIDLQRLAKSLTDQKVRQALVQRLNLDAADINTAMVLDWMRSTGRAEWFAEQAESDPDAPAPDAEPLDAGRLLEVADAYRRQQDLQQAVGPTVPEDTGSILDLAGATRWLILLSFLVCTVGVANAMFMSVTERFTEIATMKCLGALDATLMMMFLFESALQGLVGALIGVVLGLLLALVRGMVAFGSLIFGSIPYDQVGLGLVAAIVSGLVLAVIAAVGPAYMAARLAPMEAMRVE